MLRTTFVLTITRHRRLLATLVVVMIGTACTADGEAPGSAPSPPDDAPAITVPPEAEREARLTLAAEFEGLYPAIAAPGRLVEVDLVARESVIDLVEAGPTTVWTYNGTVPGPQIEVEVGDTVRATLTNELTSPTSIHWHGIRVPNDMDGVPGLNQTALAPGESFTYEFTPPDPGTYWYHSHTLGSEQLDRGLYGAIIVRNPAEVESFDVDATWILDDWLLDETGQIIEEFFDNHVAMHHGRYGELVTANGEPAPILTVRPGERVRLRLVNASNGRWYEPRFDGLGARVLAVDGQTASRPVRLDDVTLAAGNRLDVVFDAPMTPGAHAVVDGVFGADTPLGTILVEGDPVAADHGTLPLNSSVPDWAAAAALTPDIDLTIEVGVDEDLFARFRFNGRSYPDVAPVHLEQGTFAKIRLDNRTGVLHPIHLHGQFFKVLTRGGVPVDEPFFRDTIFIDGQEVVEIGLVPLETGQWLLHCHIQEHAEAGMATVALVRAPGADLPELPDLRAGHIGATLTAPEGDMDPDEEILP